MTQTTTEPDSDRQEPSASAQAADDAAKAERWLSALGTALSASDSGQLEALFRSDAYWRDLVAFTGFIRSFAGASAVAQNLALLQKTVSSTDFRLSVEHTAPSRQPRPMEETIEAFFDFETAQTNAKGVVRLVPADNEIGTVAVGLMTAAQELKGFEEPVGAHRRDYAVPHQFSGPNWKEHMDEVIAFADREPEVVVVGAGQGGLTVAAALRHMGVDVLAIEKNDRVGDNWRNRYRALTLHNLLSVNKMPHISFPRTYPEYLPKDMFGNWLETFATHLEVPVWTNAQLESGQRDPETGEWALRVNRDGEIRELRPKHVVLATGGGICAVPSTPEAPGLDQFTGKVLHSSAVGTNLEDAAGRKVLVFGTGTSAHDIASQLVDAGAQVTMVQRNPSIVISQSTANLYLGLFEERPAEEVDLIANANSMEATREGYVVMTKIAADLDRDLTSKLEAVGFRTNNGLDDAGYFWNFMQRGGGYYINVGTSQQIIDGTIKLRQFSDIETFTPTGIRVSGEGDLDFDIAIFATGYANQSAEIRQLFGDEIADRVGPIWGYGSDGEIRNTWRPTPQDGLWTVGGGIPHARNYGRYVALQIKARLSGLVAGVDTSNPSLWA